MTLSRLDKVGAERLEGLIDEIALQELEVLLVHVPRSPGTRLQGEYGLADWLRRTPVADIVTELIGATATPVRAILFDKSASQNWSLGWHQDRTIAVRQRRDVPGFERWNVKGGVQHVEPPFGYLERMLTTRIHLDPVPPENAPLRVIQGSHHSGRIAEADIDQFVENGAELQCLAERGDVWIYRTTILHASQRSRAAGRRRVLQVDYSGDDLPIPLAWAGVS